MAANGTRAKPELGSPEDPEEQMKRFAAAEAITMLSTRAFRSHIPAVPVQTYNEQKSRTVRKKHHKAPQAQKQPPPAPPRDQPIIPATVHNEDVDMPTVVSDVSRYSRGHKLVTYQPVHCEDEETDNHPIPACDLVIVENSIPITVMSREELATKRPVKTTSPRHLPPKKRRIHNISPPRAEAPLPPTKRPQPPKTLALPPVSPALPKVPLDLSPAVTPDFNTDMAVEYVRNKLDMDLNAIDRKTRENAKVRTSSIPPSPLGSPTKTPTLMKELANGASRVFPTPLRRSQSTTEPMSPRMAELKPKAAEDIVPGSAQALALTETLRSRMMKKDEDGDIALHIAVVHGNVPLVRVLISLMKTDNHTLDTANNIKQTALHLSVLTEHVAIMRMLLEGGANPNLGDRHGDSCYHLAVRRQNMEIMKMLMEESHVQPDLGLWNNEGFTPLHIAAQKQFYSCITYLIQCGADVNAKDGKSGRTSLFHAVEKGDYDVCKHLIKLGASPEIANYAGFTPFAATPKSSPICVLLSSFFPGKKVTSKPDQFQGQEFPELKIKQIASGNEIIYRLNTKLKEKASEMVKGEVKLIARGHESVKETADGALPSPVVRREIMFPDSFKRLSKSSKKHPGRPPLKRSESMPAHLTYSRLDSEDGREAPKSPRSYSPVSDVSENSNDHPGHTRMPSPPRIPKERIDSPSSIIERARMQKISAFPPPLRLDIPKPAPDPRFLPMMPTLPPGVASEPALQSMVPVMTSLEGRFVPTMVPAYALQQYIHSQHLMYRMPMSPMSPMHGMMYRPMMSPTSPPRKRFVKEEKKEKPSPSNDCSPETEKAFELAKMESPITRSISPEERKPSSELPESVRREPESSSSSKTETPTPVKVKQEVVENPAPMSTEPVTTTATEPTPLPDSSCPDLPMFGIEQTLRNKTPSPVRTFRPFPMGAILTPSPPDDGVKIDKKDLMSKIRSKVKARLSPQSSFEEKHHTKLSRSSSLGTLPLERMTSEDLPSVLQDVK